MKYLSNKAEFLKSAKYKVNEAVVSGAGPFANDIAWGDSLLGRMLHSFARKAKIGINLKRMDSVIKRLQTQFDYLLDTSKINGGEIDEVTKHEIDMLRISILIGELIETIKDTEVKGKNHLDEVIKATEETIRSIKYMVLETKKSEPDRKEVLSKLDEFLVLLKDIEEDKEEDKEEETSTEKTPYHLYMANIKSITDILNSYKNAQTKRAENFKNEKDKQKELDLLYKNKIEQWKVKQKSMRTGEIGSNINPGEGTRNRIRREAEDELKQESIIFENVNTTPIKMTVKSLYTFIMSDKDNLVELQGLLSSYNKISDDNKSNLSMGKFTSIKRLYDYINKSSVSENLDSLLSNSDKLGNKIKELYNVSKSGDFSSIQDESLKNALTSFNKTMSDIISYKPEVKKIESQDEGRLLKYKGFIKVFESDEVSDETKESKTKDRYDLSYPWNKVFDEKYLKKWIVTDELKDKVNQKLEKIERDGNKYVIKGIDPILEIVKIFNRSYKLHTSQTIPGGRTGGKVSNRKMSEYEYIGKGAGPSTNDTGSGFRAGMGPYRNIKIFTKWEDAVLDIIKDSKYQVLFNEDTVIEVGDADDRMNVDYSTSRDKNSIESGVDDKGNITKTLVNKKEKKGRIEGGGKVLLKFINDMLDGDNLYKGESGGGAQKKFINTYFKVDVKTEELGFTTEELETNAKSANDTKDEVVVEFKSVNEITNKDGCIFNINGEYYMIITGSDSDFVYVKYSKSFNNINRYIRGEKVKGMKGDLSTLEGGRSTIHYGRINGDHFRGMRDKKVLKLGDDLKLKSINLTEYTKSSINSNTEEVEIGNIDNLYSLKIKGGENDGKEYFLPTSASQDSKSGDKPRKDYGVLKEKLKK